MGEYTRELFQINADNRHKGERNNRIPICYYEPVPGEFQAKLIAGDKNPSRRLNRTDKNKGNCFQLPLPLSTTPHRAHEAYYPYRLPPVCPLFFNLYNNPFIPLLSVVPQFSHPIVKLIIFPVFILHQQPWREWFGRINPSDRHGSRDCRL